MVNSRSWKWCDKMATFTHYGGAYKFENSSEKKLGKCIRQMLEPQAVPTLGLSNSGSRNGLRI